MDASIIYVNWNCAEEIAGSISSVRQWTRQLQYEIIVVDNESPQGNGELEQDPGIRLIRSGRNGGFGAGCNYGARHASGRYLLFLNPDTRFLNDVLGDLSGFLEKHPKAALAGPLIVDLDGKIQFNAGRSLPTLKNDFLEHSTLAYKFPQASWASRPWLSDWDHLSTREVEGVVGACMLVRSAAFHAVEGFDEAFFLYSEELDLCQRLRKAGLEIWYVHTARLLHKERQSTLQFYGSTARMGLQIVRSQHQYFRKHYGAGGGFIWRNMIALIYLVRYLRNRDQYCLDVLRWAISG